MRLHFFSETLEILKMALSNVKLSTKDILKGLDDLRSQELLCDVHLVAEGAKFPAHRVVLAAASPYFQAMFTGGFQEGQMREITLNDTSSVGLKGVLNAIYTAELSLSAENVCDVLSVASLLQLNDTVKHCGRFLVSIVSEQNCLSFLAVAEKFDLQEVVDVCNKFILENFDTFLQSTEFEIVTKEKLCDYLSDDRLKVRNGEIEVFRAILKWFEANRCTERPGVGSTDLADLMQHVRFPVIPSKLLFEEVLSCPLIKENAKCMRQLTEALKFHCKLFSQPFQEGKQIQHRGKEMLVLIQLSLQQERHLFNVDETKLHMLNVTGTEPFQTQISEQTLPMNLCPSFSLLKKGNYLFLFGANADSNRTIAVRFDVKTNTWMNLEEPRSRAAIGMATALLKGNIFVLGGLEFIFKRPPHTTNPRNSSTNMSERVLRYSIEKDSWTKSVNLPEPLCFHSAASHESYVYCAGGSSLYENTTNKLYAFDVVSRIWHSKASMNRKRTLFGIESLDGKLVACGGKRSPNVEIYNILEDQWTLIQDSILRQHISPATIVLNGNVYLIGGTYTDYHRTKPKADYVSCVDVENATVRRVCSLPFLVSCHACALLTVPNTTEEAEERHEHKYR